MTAFPLLQKYSTLGIILFISSTQKLCYKAPKGIITDAIRQELQEHKEEIISFLHQEQIHDETLRSLPQNGVWNNDQKGNKYQTCKTPSNDIGVWKNITDNPLKNKDIINFQTPQTLEKYIEEEISLDYEERAAILEYEANIPRPWAEAFAKLQLRSKPHNISEKRWQAIINQVGILLDANSPHLKNIITYGWSIEDIFGCHHIAPEQRYDAMGLLMLLHNREIVAVKKDVITLRQDRYIQTYRRSLNCHKPEQSTLMEVK